MLAQRNVEHGAASILIGTRAGLKGLGLLTEHVLAAARDRPGIQLRSTNSVQDGGAALRLNPHHGFHR